MLILTPPLALALYLKVNIHLVSLGCYPGDLSVMASTFGVMEGVCAASVSQDQQMGMAAAFSVPEHMQTSSKSTLSTIAATTTIVLVWRIREGYATTLVLG